MQTNGSDDYRSVIDDLTIENKKLRAKLRKYEKSSATHLEKDKLFEVKIHALPARKRRELEDTLRSFALSLNGSPETNNTPADLSQEPQNDTPSLGSGSKEAFSSGSDSRELLSSEGSSFKQRSSLATSNSRFVDSAYSSNPTMGHTPRSTLNHPHLHGRKESTHVHDVKKQKMQSFLSNIPEGLLPKKSPAMTDKEKKKIVVRRLEQLFTGKKANMMDENSHSLQQQEVSKSAAKADRVGGGKPPIVEGVREAHMLSYDIDIGRGGNFVEDAEDGGPVPRDRSDITAISAISSPEQRPTRPLDLDPDRAQIPADNVEYIRHLGLSAPHLSAENSSESAADEDGWIYLNLLIGMAQLHIINVTPDFVRSAVADVSEKFQLSQDGRRIRWTGGSEGTRLSSDSGNSSVHQRSDSDCVDDFRNKRRKINVGRSASAPTHAKTPTPAETALGSDIHYKPLFHHQQSSSEESSTNDSNSCFSLRMDWGKKALGSSTKNRLSCGSHVKTRGDDGPIVFYNRAQFFTDLSGDQGSMPVPSHTVKLGKDVDSDYPCALGSKPCEKSRSISRTPSGSYLSFRPFKDYSKCPDLFQTQETRPKTPELLTGIPDLDLPAWSLEESTFSRNRLLDLHATGLGGTQPADHFAITVHTRRTVLDGFEEAQFSRFSKPSPNLNMFLRKVSDFSPAAPQDIDHQHTAGSVALKDANLEIISSSGNEPPIKSQIISTQFCELQPSRLPEPSYYADIVSTEDESCFSSPSGISSLRQDAAPRSVPLAFQSDEDWYEPDTYSENGEEERYGEVDDQGSIDILAHARGLDPEAIAAQEQEFETDLKRVPGLPLGSCAATMDGGSGFANASGSSLTDSSELMSDD